jgi:sensor c-di-GMP phosphodiesterase-like protein
VLKIDRAFIRDVLVDKDDAALCGAIIAMARVLNLEIVGEGTETLEHVQFLQSRLATIAQGFYYSKPIPKEQFLNYISQYKAGSRNNRYERLRLNILKFAYILPN